MPKQKIIKSEDLTRLKVAIINEIDDAQIQAELYSEEAEKQRCTKQSQEIIDSAERSQRAHLDRRATLHNCLVKIEKYSSEIEI